MFICKHSLKFCLNAFQLELYELSVAAVREFVRMFCQLGISHLNALFAQSLKDLYEKHNDTADGRIRVWFGVRQIINVTNHLLLGKTDAGQKLNTGIHMTRCNSICWNPREPMNFTAGNEDTHCYSFHAGKLDEAKVVHKGHVSAVMDIDYSPTGREFVTGSYDRTFGMDLAI
ncbi:uncharacterized protein LOC102706581 isoform X3 [Oryza brachyantha]|uniref:uncharacterized protein LOC102706581 isoform X3 n=1 Tax=Oryza brachyantha TaxID=4533 RepID=UPI0003EADD3E|nr:uncharacterized protein LOC102706581 isoform X3 [Oryza brachyantha]XP_015695287.1 uncharacterized protein LOC102706581 isoform X3 [Oryza brachyantha]XP_015695288.1 uncharacterized protein LOC102706581 isoform X3 [Oryza brachyantha]